MGWVRGYFRRDKPRGITWDSLALIAAAIGVTFVLGVIVSIVSGLTNRPTPGVTYIAPAPSGPQPPPIFIYAPDAGRHGHHRHRAR